MHSSWMFKPKYDTPIVTKVLQCICNYYLNWEDHGYDWTIKPAKCEQDGWFNLEVWPEGEYINYFTETIFSDEPIPTEHLTDDMLVLLTGDDGPAYIDDSEDGKEQWALCDVELSSVICALSEVGTSIYSPYGDKVFCMRVGDGEVKRQPLLDMLLTADAA